MRRPFHACVQISYSFLVENCHFLTGQSTLLKQKLGEILHPKLSNKSTDSNETTTSSESKSSQSEVGSATVARKLPPLEGSPQSNSQMSQMDVEVKRTPAQDLFRHESCSSSSSIYRSLLPSRTPSFYDGSESSPYDSVEIADSVENLQVTYFKLLGKLKQDTQNSSYGHPKMLH